MEKYRMQMRDRVKLTRFIVPREVPSSKCKPQKVEQSLNLQRKINLSNNSTTFPGKQKTADRLKIILNLRGPTNGTASNSVA